MATVERRVDEGTRRAERLARSLSEEFRHKRVAVGLTQGEVARSALISRATYQRFERGTKTDLSLIDLSRLAAVLGLDLSVRAYPGASPIRDIASLARLQRIMSMVSNPLSYRTEVPLPQLSGRLLEQRAWDGVIYGFGRRTALEMEMRITDVQALERRIALKRRDDPVESFVLLVANSRHNQRVLADQRQLFPELTRLSFGELARLLRAGQHPPNALVLV